MAMMDDSRQSEKVDRSIMLTSEATTCIQFQDFYDNCDKFLGTLASMRSVSTTITAQVMKNRYDIEMQMYVLQNQLKEILAKKDELEQERKVMQQYEAEASANKNFEVDVQVAGSKKVYLPQGTYVTNCSVCNHTCHANCAIPNDEDKHGCWAMTGKARKNDCFSKTAVVRKR